LVKNLKINIKNTQLAQALKLKNPDAKDPKKKTVKKAAEKEVKDASKKPKARIITKKSRQEIEAEAKKAEEKKVEVKAPEPAPVVEPEVKKKPEPEPKLGPVLDRKPLKPKKVEAPVKKAAPSKADDKKPSPKKPALPGQKPAAGFKDFRDFKAARKKQSSRFDSRDKQGLRDSDNEAWRKKRQRNRKYSAPEELIIRPKTLKIRLPITIKDLAGEMKLKASQLISKLFMQGLTHTLNDYLDDETTIQLLGHEFGCEITIDTSEEERIRITDKTIIEEIKETSQDNLELRPPVVTFMGHVDHGKTSLIDAIRKTNVTASEAGAITQHIGAFTTDTSAGKITILDTPGHEAFTEMRERGANVTDIVILVIAGDEGMRDQTIEAMNQAKEANVTLVIAINKSDKDGFDEQKVYRQLSDHELLPEAWGGSTITVNCSATSGDGITDLLEMLALQAEILELRANPESRARGTVLESEMHKGLGAVATVLVQNGSLRMGDAIVLGHYSGRIKTMHDEKGASISVAPPSTPVKITGISGQVEAGSEFIAVKNEKEAKELAAARAEDFKRLKLQKTRSSMDKMMQRNEESKQKMLPLIIRADVQGSLEALVSSLKKIPSDKVRTEIVSLGVGEVSESDIELAAASKAVIIGFHTQIEGHAEGLIKQTKVKVCMHDIIYHAVDEIKEIMTDMLDRLPEEKDTGKAEVKAVFKSSQLGLIAGCQVSEGTISRNHFMRLMRKGEKFWDGKIASLKRVNDDVKEVQKGIECGIVLQGSVNLKEGDELQAYEIIYHKQKL